MNGHELESIVAAIAYIEDNLGESTDLNAVAEAVRYSKYHLHRMFTDTAGITLHDYIRRRRLTEAARLLVFSGKPIIDIALTAGYESQRAFASGFKAMYKRTPAEYRREGAFYPLQLRLALGGNPPVRGAARKISYAGPEDISDWMSFLTLVVDGFPRLDERAHLRQVERYVQHRQALIMRSGPDIIGAAAFSRGAGSIDFLAAHPQYRRSGAEKALLEFMTCGLFAGREISITTFREGDRADTGQREEYMRLGFTEAEPLVEFGYPTQRLVLAPGRRGAADE